jgi:hypothetical protein
VLITLGAVMITLITSLLVSFSNDELQKILQNDEFKRLHEQNLEMSMTYQQDEPSPPKKRKAPKAQRKPK